MKVIALVLVLAGACILAYLLLTRLDIFLRENRETIKEDTQKNEPSCMVLTEDMPEEEMLREIRAFRSRHENMHILLCDSHEKHENNGQTK